MTRIATRTIDDLERGTGRKKATIRRIVRAAALRAGRAGSGSPIAIAAERAGRRRRRRRGPSAGAARP